MQTAQTMPNLAAGFKNNFGPSQLPSQIPPQLPQQIPSQMMHPLLQDGMAYNRDLIEELFIGILFHTLWEVLILHI